MRHLLLGEVLSVYERWFYTPAIVCEEKLRRYPAQLQNSRKSESGRIQRRARG